MLRPSQVSKFVVEKRGARRCDQQSPENFTGPYPIGIAEVAAVVKRFPPPEPVRHRPESVSGTGMGGGRSGSRIALHFHVEAGEARGGFVPSIHGSGNDG